MNAKKWTLMALMACTMVPATISAAAQDRRDRQQAQQQQQDEHNPRIAEIRIALHDVNARKDLGIIGVNDTVVVHVGDRIRLRLVAVPQNDNRGDRYPSGRFTGPTGDRPEVTISEIKEDRGSALLEVNRRKDGDTFFRYEILDDLNIDRRLVKGTVAVRIVEAGYGGGGQGYPSPTPPSHDSGAEQYARRVVTALYQGILMRDPDPAANARIERIAREGHRAAVDEAMSIADSRESRIEIYSRGITQEQRLLAMYKQLMGLDQRQIPENDWRLDLQRLRDGRIPELVNLMVQSKEFRLLYGYGSQQHQY